MPPTVWKMKGTENWLLAAIVVIVVALASMSCHDGCDPEETRCSGTRVEICNAEEDWELVMDCDSVEPVEMDWQCCFEAEFEEHGCVPGGCGGDA